MQHQRLLLWALSEDGKMVHAGGADEKMGE
jgi:hypothetical protein